MSLMHYLFLVQWGLDSIPPAGISVNIQLFANRQNISYFQAKKHIVSFYLALLGIEQ